MKDNPTVEYRKITPFIDMFLIKEVEWEQHLKRLDKTLLPSGIIELTSPMSTMKEVYFITFDSTTPKQPTNQNLLEKLFKIKAKEIILDIWYKENPEVDVVKLVDELGWGDLIHRFDLISYESDFSHRRQAFPLIEGVWISYREQPTTPPHVSPKIGTLNVEGVSYDAFIVTLPNIEINSLGSEWEIKPLLEGCASEHFGRPVEWDY